MVIDRMKTLELWRQASILPERKMEVNHIAGLIMNYRGQFYDPVEKALGVPWYVVGALDYRESGFHHDAYLGNGDPLHLPSVHVPRGRGPFRTWYDGAIDALKLDGMDHLPPGGHWDVVTALIKCEGYNGLGYASKGLPSPYIYGATNIQKPGKYVSDGHFDWHDMDTQVGCGAIWLSLKAQGIDVGEA